MPPRTQETGSSEEGQPLVVDLDGTLLDSDLLVECAFAYLRYNPLRFFSLLLWLLRGRAYLKTRLAREVDLDVQALPYNGELLAKLEDERRTGRPIWLATASDQTLAEAIAQHINLFDGVIGTQDGLNLTGAYKRDALEQRFGKGGFDYVGNETRDLPIWEAAATSWAVNPSRRAERGVRRLGNAETVLRTRPGYLRTPRPEAAPVGEEPVALRTPGYLPSVPRTGAGTPGPHCVLGL